MGTGKIIGKLPRGEWPTATPQSRPAQTPDGTSGCATSGTVRVHGPTIDLVVDPVCQAAQILHFRGEASEDLTQEPPDCVCDIADTRVAYVTDQPAGANGYGVYHPTVDFQVQYAGCGFVLMDLYSDYPGVPGVHVSDAAVAFLGSACDTAEAVH